MNARRTSHGTEAGRCIRFDNSVGVIYGDICLGELRDKFEEQLLQIVSQFGRLQDQSLWLAGSKFTQSVGDRLH